MQRAACSLHARVRAVGSARPARPRASRTHHRPRATDDRNDTATSTVDNTAEAAAKPAEVQEVGLGLNPYQDKKSTLISDNWQGDEYTGSGFNVLTLILLLTFAVPLIGLAFAYFSYGSLWTGQWGVIPY